MTVTREYDLPEAELQVLQGLWQLGPASVRDVLEHLHACGRKVAYTTVLTFLTRLEQKGFVTSDKSDLAYVYRAKVSRERVSRSRLRKLLDQLYDGAAAPLVVQLMRTERFSSDEINQLQNLLNELESKNKPSDP